MVVEDNQGMADAADLADTQSDTGVSFDRDDAETARRIIERLLPDKDERRSILGLLAELIGVAHEFPDKWGVTLSTDQMALNVGGGLYVLRMRRRGVALASIEHEPLIAADSGRGFERVPDSRWREKEAEEWPPLLATLLPAIKDFIRYTNGVSKTPLWLPSRQAHSPGVLRYLEAEMDITLPDPTYAATQNFWAFQWNPKIYDLKKAIEEVKQDTWRTGGSKISPGDRALFWKSLGGEKNRGIVCLAEIVVGPTERAALHKGYFLQSGSVEITQRVVFRYVPSSKLPIWIENLPEKLRTMSVVTGQGSAFKVSAEEWKILMDTIGGWPDDENRAIILKPPLPKCDLNTILYGPPGTGKTYETARRAVTIIDGSAPDDRGDLMQRYKALVTEKRVGFVTFHQSYSYEDFVEGIRPVMGGAGNGNGGPRYEITDGILKQIALQARAASCGFSEDDEESFDEVNQENDSEEDVESEFVASPLRGAGKDPFAGVTIDRTPYQSYIIGQDDIPPGTPEWQTYRTDKSKEFVFNGRKRLIKHGKVWPLGSLAEFQKLVNVVNAPNSDFILIPNYEQDAVIPSSVQMADANDSDGPYVQVTFSTEGKTTPAVTYRGALSKFCHGRLWIVQKPYHPAPLERRWWLPKSYLSRMPASFAPSATADKTLDSLLVGFYERLAAEPERRYQTGGRDVYRNYLFTREGADKIRWRTERIGDDNLGNVQNGVLRKEKIALLWDAYSELPRITTPQVYKALRVLVSAYAVLFNELKRIQREREGLPPLPETFEQTTGTGTAEGEAPRFVLIIDEINRGNVSKILGELITLLEDDKRIGAENELVVTLPYSREAFALPSNLYIVGTMNTADKSLALLDIALRRRFVFDELTPDFALCQSLSPVMQQALNELNRRITLRKDRDHRIGHAYFIRCESENEFNAIFQRRIIPLLQEYFFNDWGGLMYVLNESEANAGFIRPLGDGADSGARNKWQWHSDVLPAVALFPLAQLTKNYKLGGANGVNETINEISDDHDNA